MKNLTVLGAIYLCWLLVLGAILQGMVVVALSLYLFAEML